MFNLYKIIIQRLNVIKKQKTNTKNIIKMYWLTNMACKIVYINKHYKTGIESQLDQFLSIYNTIIQSKINDITDNIANHKLQKLDNTMDKSFINSNYFDMITINEIYSILKTYKQIHNPNVKIIHVPSITIHSLHIPQL